MTLKSSTSGRELLEYLDLLKPFLQAQGNTEICINRPGQVFTEGTSGWITHDVPALTFNYCRQLVKLAANYSGQKCDESMPIMSATLPYGERIQVVIPPASQPDTVSMTIRKPSTVSLTLDDYERAGAFDECADFSRNLQPVQKDLLGLKESHQYRAFLELAVAARQNIVISGSTGSGKTTFMKSLVSLVPDSERLISIEDVDELHLYKSHPNTVSMFYTAEGQGTSNMTQQHLLESSLRMKPDRIFCAELRRGDEAFYYLRNVNSGHPGSITSIHANGAKDAFEQLMLFIKESSSGSSLSREDIKQLLFMCVDIVVQFKNINGRRVVTEIYYDPEFKRQQTF